MRIGGTIIGDFHFPASATVTGNLEVFQSSDQGHTVRLIYGDDRHFVVLVYRGNNLIQSSRYQKLICSKAGMANIRVFWTPTKTGLTINGYSFKLADQSSQVVEMELPSALSIQVGELPLKVTPSLAQSKEERLFLEVVQDVQGKIASKDSYQLLKTSGLLRQLLLDGHHSLLHQVNKEYRFKFKFYLNETPSRPTLPDHDHISAVQSLDPGGLVGRKVIELNLDKFLKHECVFAFGDSINVGDVISLNANAKGGVHLGKPKTEKTQRLKNWEELMIICGQEASEKLLIEIAKVTLRGIRELVAEIQLSADR